MPKVDVVNVTGAKVGEMDLNDSVFGVEENEHLMHMAVRMHLDNSRVGTADTKTRAEVDGGGRKPWRQKGTGRARQGTIRSPLWRKGGVVFGPHPRDFGFEMPRKQRRLALKSALSSKLRSGEIIVLDELRLSEPRTREMVKVLSNLNVGGRTALVVTAAPDESVSRSSRNIAGVTTSTAQNLNVYDVLAHEKVVLTKDAAKRVEEVLGTP
ncbi:MAG: 50S ribosomal protein L4 [Firmicutes bacterium]|nr:50S ribosomal protein L4 [Bacillota bacterium]